MLALLLLMASKVKYSDLGRPCSMQAISKALSCSQSTAANSRTLLYALVKLMPPSRRSKKCAARFNEASLQMPADQTLIETLCIRHCSRGIAVAVE